MQTGSLVVDRLWWRIWFHPQHLRFDGWRCHSTRVFESAGNFSTRKFHIQEKFVLIKKESGIFSRFSRKNYIWIWYYFDRNHVGKASCHCVTCVTGNLTNQKNSSTIRAKSAILFSDPLFPMGGNQSQTSLQGAAEKKTAEEAERGHAQLVCYIPICHYHMNQKTRDLATKAKVLRCHRRRGRWGGGRHLWKSERRGVDKSDRMWHP